MNYPNPNKKEHYRFVSEFLDILGITDNDIKIIDENIRMKDEFYISTL